MPNTIKYNTSSESNALSIGNMHMGVGDVGKGPTESTGFYNGINPPNGGYTIYIHKTTGGPSILCPTGDAELIDITNGIAVESYTTVNECFNYFDGQDDKMVMHNPINYLVTDGLVFCVNAGIIPSYPRNNNTWHDLSGGGDDGTLVNNPTFNSIGAIELDGVDDRINISNSSTNNISDNFTFSILVKSSTWTSGNQEGLVQKGAISNYGAYLRGGGGTVSFYTTPTSYWAPGPNIGGDGKWYCLTFIYSYSELGYKQIYVNGSYSSQLAVSVPINSNTSDINIGYASVGSPRYLNAEVANYKLYNKVLTSTEILQNYYQAPIVTDGLVFAVDAGNLVSYESGSTTAYSLTGSVDGTLTNGVGFSGGSGGTWDFDGVDDKIPLGYQSTMNNLDITQEAWVNADLLVNWHGIISNMPSWGTGFSLQIGPTQNIAAMVSGTYLKTSWAPQTGVWYHIVATHRNSDDLNVLYVNGVQENTSTRGISYNGNAVTTIGAFYSGGGSITFGGKMGPVRTYNRALTAEEVSQNYNADINKFN